jgi:hypothetical protein
MAFPPPAHRPKRDRRAGDPGAPRHARAGTQVASLPRLTVAAPTACRHHRQMMLFDTRKID